MKSITSPIQIILITLFTLYKQTNSCFIVHYVVYFQDIPMKYYLQMSQNSSYPYLVHLNQPLNLPNNRTFSRQITPVQMSDIKKVEVIYHHGGLYLDNDQFIDYQCVKASVCQLKGLYFLDWTYIKERWKNTVPLSFIYASDPFNDTLRLSLEGLNQSKQGDAFGPRTVYFSGPSHMQEYRSGMSFVRIPKNCQFHRADRSWIAGKPPNQLSHQRKIQQNILRQFTSKQKQAKPKFVQLWKTHTVIYPKNFNISIQDRIDEAYNHIQMIDSVVVKIRVIQYSKRSQTKQLLVDFLAKYNIQVVGEKPVQVGPVVENKVKQQAKPVIKQYKQQPNPNPTITIAKQQNKITNTNTNTTNTTIPIPIPIQNNANQNNPSQQNTHTTPQKTPHNHPTTKNTEPSNKDILILINKHFYLLVSAIVLMVVGVSYVCYRCTKCCKNNNYESTNKISSIRNKIKQQGQTMMDLQEEELGEVHSFAQEKEQITIEDDEIQCQEDLDMEHQQKQ